MNSFREKFTVSLSKLKANKTTTKEVAPAGSEDDSSEQKKKKIIDDLINKRIDKAEAKIRFEAIDREGRSPTPDKTGADNSKPKAVINPDTADDNTGRLENADAAIAIIGMSGRFPDAEDVNEFWDNLMAIKNSITDYPGERGWNIEEFYDPKPQTPGKTYTKKGAFLQDIDKFDPLFFSMSPREAETMDPSERIFLQEAWRAIEDAGYAASGISGQPWGVFACAKGDYSAALRQSDKLYFSPTDSFPAARLSYLLNLVGPALSVDTACSSTLTAIAHACDSLVLGNCNVAIAGGGGIYCTPGMLVTSSQSLLLSPDGQCFTFDERANGTVLGEAIGAVVLKPLESALKENDHIYGVIRGWGVNQDGSTNGLTAPSSQSQTQLQTNVYKKYHINPEDIDVVEAHGTGTALGDKIEAHALTESFRQFTDRKNYCALGSLKTNIGHAFFGAGTASLIKILLSLKHKLIPANGNFKQINPYIDIKESPFFVNTEAEKWEDKGKRPRTAVINSFGATGVNAHLVIEEHRTPAQHAEVSRDIKPVAIPLSAKEEPQLIEYVEKLIRFIDTEIIARPDVGKESLRIKLDEFAYTLQVGRDQMPIRWGVVAGSFEELRSTLTALLEGKKDLSNVYSSIAKSEHKRWSGEHQELFENDDELARVTSEWFKQGKVNQLMKLWVEGGNIDWQGLHRESGSKLKRVSLPTYAFAKDAIKMPSGGQSDQNARLAGRDILHSLVHKNISSLHSHRYSTTFTGNEFFFEDHRIKGRKTLPGVVYLELARAAAELALDGAPVDKNYRIALKNVVWLQPFVFNENQNQIVIKLNKIGDWQNLSNEFENTKIEFEIYRELSDKTVQLHCQGLAVPALQQQAPTFSLMRLLAETSSNSVESEALYPILDKLGFNLGPGHQGVKALRIGQNKVLAKIEVPKTVTGEYCLHPSMMDSALQASMGLWLKSDENMPATDGKQFLPFALENLVIHQPCKPEMWVVVSPADGFAASNGGQKLNYDLLDVNGEVCVQMHGFSAREVGDDFAEQSAIQSTFEPTREASDVVLFGATRNESTTSAINEEIKFSERHIILCDVPEKFVPEPKTNHDGVFYHLVASSKENQADGYEQVTIAVFEIIRELQAQLYSKDSSNCTILIQLVIPSELSKWGMRGLAGLLRSAHQEASQLTGQLISIDIEDGRDSMMTKLDAASCTPAQTEIYFQGDKNQTINYTRWSQQKTFDQPGDITSLPWRDHGVYLLTGGSGGLGLIFAYEIARKARQVTLILTGRSALDEQKKLQIEELRATGATVSYIQADVADRAAVDALVNEILTRHDTLNGVVHIAGIIRDNYIARKPTTEIREVLQPKVSGLVNLDEACQRLPLEFFVAFSSMAVLGNAGQTDYSAANAFMDHYIAARNILADEGLRHGRSLAINWPLWKEGGMKIDDAYEKLMHNNMGFIALETQKGIQAFYDAWFSSYERVMVVAGNVKKIERFYSLADGSAGQSASIKPTALKVTKSVSTGEEPSAPGMLNQSLERELIELLAEESNIDKNRISAHTEFGQYGFDSISLTKLCNAFNARFDLNLMPTLFYECPTVASTADYLLANHGQSFYARYQPVQVPNSDIKQPENTGYGDFTDATVGATAGAETAHVARSLSNQKLPTDTINSSNHNSNPEPVAIVGMAGCFPKAQNLDEYWQNLLQARDCITEIPASRWDWQAIYGQPSLERKTTNAKWGGFIEGIEEFDPFFFNISPKAALTLDPQHRMLMKCAYAAVEDAGIDASQLAGSNTGIYVGTAGNQGYDELIARHCEERNESLAPVPVSFGVARISYFLDLHGPSMPIETTCSSSLVAIHRGVSAIQSGECDMVIAGGVQTISTSTKHISWAKEGMLCEDGRCKTFSSSANGFVRSEGVGMLLLKRLAQAEADGDRIYGLIRGSAENHGGRAKDFSAPNPGSQARVIEAAYKKANVDIRTVTYVEAHGTGTELGDPIEVNGLKMAFKHLYSKSSATINAPHKCGLGSVKTNIGHTEMAAGVAGVIKVLLQFKHKTLVKSLHAEEVNPYIELQDSPFFLLSEAREWQALTDEQGNTLPRRAGVSSFGFCGVNSHVVLEEYTQSDNPVADVSDSHLIVLSAKSEDQLRDRAEQLLQFVKEKGESDDVTLSSIAYTLQAGREPLAFRWSAEVSNTGALVEVLALYLRREAAHKYCTGRVKEGREHEKGIAAAMETWLDERDLEKVQGLWVEGVPVSWKKLWRNGKPQKISLPTYPFASERYWIGDQVRSEKCEETAELMRFEEVWVERSFDYVKTEMSLAERANVVCFFSAEDSHTLLEAASQFLPAQTQLVHIQPGSAYDKNDVTSYTVFPNDYRQLQRLLQDVQADFGQVDALIYNVSLTGNPDATHEGPVALFRAIKESDFPLHQVVLAGQYKTAVEQCTLDSMIAYERSLTAVLPGTQISVVMEADPGAQLPSQWVANLCRELTSGNSENAWYKNGKRYATEIRELPTHEASEEVPLKTGATYLITGGCGALGLLFAEHLVSDYQANLILTGRSELTERQRQKLETLNKSGSKVAYLRADLNDKQKMQAGLAELKAELGEIRGVIHAAGLISDTSALEKGAEDFAKVMSPKVSGTLALDTLLSSEPLDFICYFSSTAAVLGDFGVCDYAIANRFQTAYGKYRQQCVERGELPGKSIVINWPLWLHGGMGFQRDEEREMYLRSSGLEALPNQQGLSVFENTLHEVRVQHIVLLGQRSRIERFLRAKEGSENSLQKPGSTLALGSTSPLTRPGPGLRQKNGRNGLTAAECVERELKQQVSQLLETPVERLDAEEILVNYGFDSMTLTRFAANLTNHFGVSITPTVFYNHVTLRQLVDYFMQQHGSHIERFYQDKEDNSATEVVENTGSTSYSSTQNTSGNEADRKAAGGDGSHAEIPGDAIAIVGMSGRFPNSRTVDELWQLLFNGESAVTEIPTERFDWREQFGTPDADHSKTNGKWCGIAPGVEEFDPLFFDISPLDAENMDPRQRLLLQESWRALEDAGYGESAVGVNRIGVYAGAEQGDYAQVSGVHSGNVTSNHEAMLAARLSYLLNLDGPVLTINTACSSGLVALHQACVSLRNQECDTALAAGVNLLLTHKNFVGMAQSGMLSNDGKTYAFDCRANGLVPGEAIAVLVLKRLSDAEADRDNIRAVIRGSGVNYDGKTNGITAPSGVAQTKLITDVYKRYGIDAEKIDYVVTHGTGTRLGDPVEINALTDAFRQAANGSVSRTGYCAITSSKTNLGHTFAASGIVSMIGLVQALQHETIPASLNCEQDSDYIDWEASPFYVNKGNKVWPQQKGRPRFGAVSAFGMSGTNAHVVVSSYDRVPVQVSSLPGSYLLVLSAKSQTALDSQIKNLGKFLKEQTISPQMLNRISHTLSTGRHHFDHRLALVIDDAQEAIATLDQYGNSGQASNLLFGEVNRGFKTQPALEEYAHTLLQAVRSGNQSERSVRENLLSLADLYCQGYALPLQMLFAEKPQSISLPTYPFARRRCWVSEAGQATESKQVNETTETTKKIEIIEKIEAEVHVSPSQAKEEYQFINKAEEFYTLNAVKASDEFKEDYLTFAPFAEKIPGFSMSKLFLTPEAVPEFGLMAQDKMRELRQVLFCKENFNRIQRVFDFGCGNGTDVIQIAKAFPNVETCGYTITKAQAEVGNRRIAQMGLSERARIEHRDSGHDAFLVNNDLILGIEVSFHIRNKNNLFNSISTSLSSSGRVLLMDYIANLRGQIVDPSVEITIPTEDDWVELLSTHNLLIDEMIDVSQEIANFLYDPDLDRNTANVPQVARDTLKNYANQSIALENGFISYVLMKLVKNPGLDRQQLEATNRQRIRAKTPYSHALDEMLKVGHIPYPTTVQADQVLEVQGESKGTLLLNPVWQERSIVNPTHLAGDSQFFTVLCGWDSDASRAVAYQLPGECIRLDRYPGESLNVCYQRAVESLLSWFKQLIEEKRHNDIVIQLVVPEEPVAEVFSGLAGLLKTARLEKPNLLTQMLVVERFTEGSQLRAYLESERRGGCSDDLVRYAGSKRQTKEMQELAFLEHKAALNTKSSPWRKGGVYLITGGLGGLGQIFAREIITQCSNAVLILTGRSPLNQTRQAQLDALQQLNTNTGATVIYRQLDVADAVGVDGLFDWVRNVYGGFQAIIHSAGVILDNFIVNKTVNESRQVLQPKVAGVENLDKASADMALDLFVLFSSISGTHGNPGQADYAAANGFLDAYAQYRHGLVMSQQRRGRTVSIAWPYWAEGGMSFDERLQRQMTQSFGIEPLTTTSGLAAFYHVLESEQSNVAVVAGEKQPLTENFVKHAPGDQEHRNASVDTEVFKTPTKERLKELFAQTLKFELNELKDSIPFSAMGVDSLNAVSLIEGINREYEMRLPTSVVFEFNDLASLSAYIDKNKPGEANHAPVSTAPVITVTKKSTLQCLKEIFARTLKFELNELSDTTPFSAMGVDSLNAVALVEAINGEYEMRLPTSVVFEFNDLASLSAYIDKNKPSEANHAPVSTAPVITVTKKSTLQCLKEIFARTLKFELNELSDATPFSAMGVDSLNAVALVEAINGEYDMRLPTSVVFEFNDLVSLSGYVERNQPREHSRKKSFEAAVVSPEEDFAAQSLADDLPREIRSSAAPAPVSNDGAVAIVGLSCRAAGIANSRDYWDTLANGKDNVSSVKDLEWLEFLSVHRGSDKPFRYGAMASIDEFDPLFFNISPKEAESMEVNQRVILEQAYRAIEDAGYAPSSLANDRVGTIIGVMDGESILGNLNHFGMLGHENSILAGRIAYFLDLKGPALTVNTACSSGLVAVDIASKKLQAGEVDICIAGGIGIYTGPQAFAAMDAANMLSPTGDCRPFDNDADGIVVGDGAGVLILKRTEDAVAAGDHIYGVICGSSTNQDGKTSGLTVPSFLSQSRLQESVYRANDISVEDIQYIEAHGTATKLGDPVEIHALTDSFSQFTNKKSFCAIGSVKANIGHTGAAAGVLSIIKVLLSFQHAMIPPSIKFMKENQHIDFSNSPVYVNNELKDWPLNAQGKRLAAVSSFGFSGTNAHMVLASSPDQGQQLPSGKRTVIIPLSAKSEGQLLEQAKSLSADIAHRGEGDLEAIAYTLQTGRDPMSERLATVVTSLESLREKLLALCGETSEFGEWCRGSVSGDVNAEVVVTPEAWSVTREQLDKLAEQWVQGMSVDWEKLYGDARPRRVSLPTYPFARERYWLERASLTPETKSRLHPLVHDNTSTVFDTDFSATFTGSEFFLRDHRVQGVKTLPGAAHLEMAREAIARAFGLDESEAMTVQLSDVVWLRPVVMTDEALALHIRVLPESEQALEYEIYSLDDSGEETVYSQGKARLNAVEALPALELSAWGGMNSKTLAPEKIYEAFEDAGLEYGSGHRGITGLRVAITEGGVPEVLAELQLSAELTGTHEAYGLHPALLDSALQASLGLAMADDAKASEELLLPFSLGTLQMQGRIPAVAYARVAYSAGSKPGDAVQKLDVTVCDDQGNVCVALKGFSSRNFSRGSAEQRVTCLSPVWEAAELAKGAKEVAAGEHYVLLAGAVSAGEQGALVRALPKSVHCDVLGVVNPTSHTQDTHYRESALQLFNAVRARLEARPTGPVLVQLVIQQTDDETSHYLEGLSGLLKSASQETPMLQTQCLQVADRVDAETLAAWIQQNAANSQTQEVRYVDGERQIRVWREADEAAAQTPAPWRDGGVYLITGGAGGLGLIFAEAIAAHTTGATVVLVGRRPSLDDDVAQRLAALGTVNVDYQSVDIGDAGAVRGLIAHIEQGYGTLTGIIHSAGVLEDNFVLKKTAAELDRVFAPKVSGAVNLDRASQHLALEYFVCFGSLAGVLGNAGQTDYAAANGFLDAFAACRNRRVGRGERQGKTLAIDWPLWSDGGMQVTPSVLENLRQLGLAPLGREAGINAFKACIESTAEQVLVSAGEKEAIVRLLLMQAGLAEPETEAEEQQGELIASELKGGDLQEKALAYFKAQLSSALKLPLSRLDEDASMELYGMDSVMAMQLTSHLEKAFGPLAKTLFFEVQTVRALSEYFIEQYPERLHQVLGAGAAVVKAKAKTTENTRGLPVAQEPTARPGRALRRRPAPVSGLGRESMEPGAVAIIGINGRYPQAGDLTEFWDNLRAGKDCVTEIPAERWDHSVYFDPDKNRQGTSYSKWGGFIDGVDQFDPLFFNISPREAGYIDPQERLFLQCAFSAIEDAGYTRESLAQLPSVEGNQTGNVGVFVGVMYEEYQLYGAQAQAMGQNVALTGNPASIANRISYFCNFRGPSMAVDTMCSSSLTAIHLACEAMRNQRCDVAIAGGVNVTIHPNKYLALSQGNFASSTGRCESFGEAGDGYVPGEGVGALILKPAEAAIRDNDHIYGLIRGSAINHGGKTHGYSVPNPKAQSEVIVEALKEAQVKPEELSYIEAHGTGTALGDPIEIAGLTKAFERAGFADTSAHVCAIGSVKSNIGHCESAAGVAAVTKVLLQMKHKQLVPSLHADSLNPAIDFDNIPFQVQRTLAPWPQPTRTIDGCVQTLPRIAGISSFGAGGANAHVIIEEYVDENSGAEADASGTAVIVLSARREAQLIDQAKHLLHYLETQQGDLLALDDIAYTLQVGREAMEERISTTVDSHAELIARLRQYVENPEAGEAWLRGSTRNKEALAIFKGDEELQEAITKWLARGKVDKLLSLWVQGVSVNWEELYSGSLRRRISLPTYPFARERHWFDRATSTVTATSETKSRLHPLVHENTSTVFGTTFSATFTGSEFFLRDHRVQGVKTLPGAAHMEMAREASARAFGLTESEAMDVQLSDVVWLCPVVLTNETLSVHIRVLPESDEALEYEIYSVDETGEEYVYSQGKARLNAAEELPDLDLSAWTGIDEKTLEPEQVYQAFANAGLEYGSGHRGIADLRVSVVDRSGPEVLAKLQLPTELMQAHEAYGLHPALLDSALQASFGLAMADNEKASVNNALLPFSLDSLQVNERIPHVAYARVSYSSGSQPGDTVQKLDITVSDDQGRVCVALQGLSCRANASGQDKFKPELLLPTWSAATHIPGIEQMLANADTLIIHSHKVSQHVLSQLTGMSGAQSVALESGAGIDEITRCLDSNENLNHLIWVLPQDITQEVDLDGLIEAQDDGVLTGFRLVKALLSLGFDTRPISLSVITWQTQAILSPSAQLSMQDEDVSSLFGLNMEDSSDIHYPAHAGVHGFIGSVAKELSHWSVRLLDLPLNPAEETLAKGLTLPFDPAGNAWAFRQGQWHQQKMLPVQAPETIVEAKPYREGGVYVVIGGAGGLGEAWSETLIRDHQARIVWLGRRPMDDVIQSRIDRLRAFGPAPTYLQADASDLGSLSQAYDKIRSRFGAIHGLLHSAIVLDDSSVANMSEERFKASLSAKVDTSVRMAQVFRRESLDFILYFSSLISFFKAPGQSNYAAGCTFSDAFAARMGQLCQCPVKVMNWGYWGNVGVVADQSYRERMEAFGIGSIETDEGMLALEQLLNSALWQLSLLKIDKLEAIVGDNPDTAQSSVVLADSTAEVL
ncbi:SDR family NAD(P)-dependent oxidoreductase [Motilimonas sp. 1_MG-2023]|uniref:SDR family NAD(P)-dependent oxidoreductase n=1 Tax=Motilimonas sp. 1_MG-2023 TaxID=3062672 RepID=UPI0026E3102E|nr:SDR family NAD(P)-dependent oxidoreductase [Motilimonas sp. 1_MG-2023]MDO6526356.1 SDR family NAD(P)-dependent oxidoreductase [Motilimonas sp. 1_MG-2023]